MDKVRTLVVDDNNLFKESLISFLSEHDVIEVAGSVTNGQECLEHIQKMPVDLIIMDVRMSGMDGPHTTAIIKKKYPHIKIILCTVLSPRSIPQTRDRTDADGFFAKGEPLSQLITTIHSLFSL